MGRRRAALSRPLLEVSVGGDGDKPSASFGRAAGRRWAKREAGTCQQWAQVVGGSGWEEGAGRRRRRLPVSSSQAGVGRRGRREALVGHGREEGALWE